MADSSKTRKVLITAHPYADVSGTIQVPEDLIDEDEIKAYIDDHWCDINFGEPDLDFVGTDYEIS